MIDRIVISLIFTVLCVGNLTSQINENNFNCQENITKIPLISKDSLNEHLYKSFFKRNKVSLLPIHESDLFLGEDYQMLDTLYSIDSIKYAVNYKLESGNINISDIYYQNGFSEVIFNRIVSIMNNMHQISPFFDYFKRGNVLLLNKKEDYITYIIYDATRSSTQKRIDDNLKNLKPYYSKIYMFPE
jgi:hypothetical protein